MMDDQYEDDDEDNNNDDDGDHDGEADSGSNTTGASYGTVTRNDMTQWQP